MADVFEDVGDHWRDDAFERKSYAHFLRRYLTGKVTGAGTTPKLRPFTMALDANWGSGKTFFLERWAQDLKSQTKDSPACIVVSFDAWSADYAEDPLVAFMSELRAELQRALRASGLAPAARQKALKAINSATEKIRHLALPVGGIIAKGLVHKFLGVNLDQIVDAAGISDSEQTQNEAATECGSDDAPRALKDVISVEKADAALDRLFEVQLSEHSKRKNSIREFKADLGLALKALQKKDESPVPLFILVDELDRCKPSFAVGLLEAIKHVFGVPGVCVVVATNMEQLSHTVKAVYGEGFDARTYLQRFFDAIYALPSASGSQLLSTWIKERPIFGDERCCWATPGRGFIDDAYGRGHEGMLAWVFHGMGLSLRSQHQVLELMEATALGLPKSHRIHVPWLAIVCSLWHSHRDAFNLLAIGVKRNTDGNEVWNALGLDGFRRKYSQFSYHGQPTQHLEFSLRDLGSIYSSRGTEDLVKMRDRHQGGDGSLPSSIVGEVLRDAPQQYNHATAYPSGLADYLDLVGTAGHMLLRDTVD